MGRVLLLVVVAVDLALARLSWISIERHRMTGSVVLLLAALAAICHVLLFRQ